MYTVLLSSGCWVYGKGEFLQDSSNHKRYLNSYMFLYSTEDKIPKEVNSSITGYTNDCELTACIWLTDGQTLYSTYIITSTVIQQDLQYNVHDSDYSSI